MVGCYVKEEFGIVGKNKGKVGLMTVSGSDFQTSRDHLAGVNKGGVTVAGIRGSQLE